MRINWQWLHLLYQLEENLKLEKLSACKGQSKKLKCLSGVTLNSHKGMYIGGQMSLLPWKGLFKIFKAPASVPSISWRLLTILMG